MTSRHERLEIFVVVVLSTSHGGVSGFNAAVIDSVSKCARLSHKLRPPLVMSQKGPTLHISAR